MVQGSVLVPIRNDWPNPAPRMAGMTDSAINEGPIATNYETSADTGTGIPAPARKTNFSVD